MLGESVSSKRTPSPSVSWLRSHWIEKPCWALEADAPDFRFRVMSSHTP